MSLVQGAVSGTGPAVLTLAWSVVQSRGQRQVRGLDKPLSLADLNSADHTSHIPVKKGFENQVLLETVIQEHYHKYGET